MIEPEPIEDTMTNLIIRFDNRKVKLPFNVEMFTEVEKIGRIFQKLEAVLGCLIMIFKGEENIIYPLIGHLDECTRIIEKYIRLNVLYKLIYGACFLSKLKTVTKRVEELMDSSRLSLNSSRDLIQEFRLKYPELLYVVFDDNRQVRNQIESNVMSDDDSNDSTDSNVGSGGRSIGNDDSVIGTFEGLIAKALNNFSENDFKI